MGGDRRGPARAGRRAHRVRQDAGGVPLVAGPAAHGAGAGEGEALPGALHLPAQGAGRRRRAQPARAARRHPPRRRPAGPARRCPRSASAYGPATPPPQERAPARPPAARHPDHHARVAVPDADLAGARVAARRRHGHRRRGARGRRQPSAAPTWPSASSGSTPCSSSPPSGSASPRPSGRSTRSPGSSAATRPVDIVAPPADKAWDLKVVVPVEDMTAPDGDRYDDRDADGRRRRAAARSGRTSRSTSSTSSSSTAPPSSSPTPDASPSG